MPENNIIKIDLDAIIISYQLLCFDKEISSNETRQTWIQNLTYHVLLYKVKCLTGPTNSSAKVVHDIYKVLS